MCFIRRGGGEGEIAVALGDFHIFLCRCDRGDGGGGGGHDFSCF